MPKFKFIFAWYDLWIGAYYDRKNRIVYILPFPCCGIAIYFPNPVEEKGVKEPNIRVDEFLKIYEERDKLLSILRNLPTRAITIKEILPFIKPGEQMSIYHHKSKNGHGDYYMLERDNGEFTQTKLGEDAIEKREEFLKTWINLK